MTRPPAKVKAPFQHNRNNDLPAIDQGELTLAKSLTKFTPGRGFEGMELTVLLVAFELQNKRTHTFTEDYIMKLAGGPIMRDANPYRPHREEARRAFQAMVKSGLIIRYRGVDAVLSRMEPTGGTEYFHLTAEGYASALELRRSL